MKPVDGVKIFSVSEISARINGILKDTFPDDSPWDYQRKMEILEYLLDEGIEDGTITEGHVYEYIIDSSHDDFNIITNRKIM